MRPAKSTVTSRPPWRTTSWPPCQGGRQVSHESVFGVTASSGRQRASQHACALLSDKSGARRGGKLGGHQPTSYADGSIMHSVANMAGPPLGLSRCGLKKLPGSYSSSLHSRAFTSAGKGGQGGPRWHPCCRTPVLCTGALLPPLPGQQRPPNTRLCRSGCPARRWPAAPPPAPPPPPSLQRGRRGRQGRVWVWARGRVLRPALPPTGPGDAGQAWSQTATMPPAAAHCLQLTGVGDLERSRVQLPAVPHRCVVHGRLAVTKRRKRAHALQRRCLVVLQRQSDAAARRRDLQPRADAGEGRRAAEGGRLGGVGRRRLGAVEQGAQAVAQVGLWWGLRHAAWLLLLLRVHSGRLQPPGVWAGLLPEAGRSPCLRLSGCRRVTPRPSGHTAQVCGAPRRPGAPGAPGVAAAPAAAKNPC